MAKLNSDDSDSEMDISDSECHTMEEILLACKESGFEIVGSSKCAKNEGESQVQAGLTDAEEAKDSIEASLSENAASAELAVDTNESALNLESKCTKKRKGSLRQRNQHQRMKGKSYIGFSNKVNPITRKRQTPQNQHREARKMGNACLSAKCKKSKNRYCDQFSENVRESLFREFWETLTWGEKQNCVLSLVDQTTPRRCTVKKSGPLRKNGTYLYHLKLHGIRKQVCKQMFLSTLGIGDKHVRGWLTKTRTPNQLAPGRRNTKGGDLNFAKRFLEDIPKLPSHYCRKRTSKLYLEPIFRTKQQLYDAYVEKCQEKNVAPVVRETLLNLVVKKNISIYQPKKDKCDICCGWETKNVTDEEYNAHTAKKDFARAQKTKDKSDALQGKCHVLTMDVQKVLLAPMLNASALYYKTKLIVHNFTVFDLANGNATCYLWDESHAELVASVFATCLLSYLEENFQDSLPIIIFSDGCTSQNRNAIMANALIHYAVKKQKVIIQKYLEKGHTQMEVDSVHSKIETNLKGRSIYLPSDYVEVCKTARNKPEGYKVKTMEYENFFDFSVKRAYASIRPGNKKTDPHVTDLRQIKYNTDGTLEYKLEPGSDWIQFPRRSRVDPKKVFEKLYASRIPIAKRKYNDLLDLLHVIPSECHDFYKNLPHKSN